MVVSPKLLRLLARKSLRVKADRSSERMGLVSSSKWLKLTFLWPTVVKARVATMYVGEAASIM